MSARNSVFLSAFLALICASSASAAMKKAKVYIVLNDGSTLEGKYLRETETKYYIQVERKTKNLLKSEIKKVYPIEESTVVRFKVKRQPNDLMLLFARYGLKVSLEKCEGYVEKINAEEDPIEAADKFIVKNKLLPEDIDAVVEANREKFKEDYGDEVTEIIMPCYYVIGTCNKVFLKRVAIRMTNIFKEYQKQLNFAEKITSRFVIKVFDSEVAYNAAGGPRGSAAYFYPAKMELVAFYSEDEKQTMSSLYHEGMHQFLHFYVPDPPLWFDEGLAQYFETSIPTSSGYKTGVVYKDAVKYLNDRARVFKNYPSVEAIIKMERSDFYDPYRPRRSTNYATAWALTHLMIKSRNSKVRQLYVDYFYLLRDGKTYREANKEVFGKFNMGVLQKVFEKYVKRLR